MPCSKGATEYLVEDSVDAHVNLALDRGPAEGRSGAYFCAVRKGKGAEIVDHVPTQDRGAPENQRRGGPRVNSPLLVLRTMPYYLGNMGAKHRDEDCANHTGPTRL